MKRVYYFYIIATISFLLQFLTGCSMDKEKVCDQPFFEMVEQPHYIIGFRPVSGVKISAACYEQEGGFMIEINGAFAEINRTSPRQESIRDRFELFVNGAKISNDMLEIYEDYSALRIINDQGNAIPVAIYELKWIPNLDVGEQRVKIFIVQDNGEKLEYGWEFEITK